MWSKDMQQSIDSPTGGTENQIDQAIEEAKQLFEVEGQPKIVAVTRFDPRTSKVRSVELYARRHTAIENLIQEE